MPLTKEAAERFVAEWYQLVDNHGPVTDLMKRTVGEGFVARFPEGDVDYTGYAQWCIEDIRSFFDGEHAIRELQTEMGDNEAKVLAIIDWSGRSWQPPEPHSRLKEVACNILFTLEYDEETGRPLLHAYEVSLR